MNKFALITVLLAMILPAWGQPQIAEWMTWPGGRYIELCEVSMPHEACFSLPPVSRHPRLPLPEPDTGRMISVGSAESLRGGGAILDEPASLPACHRRYVCLATPKMYRCPDPPHQFLLQRADGEWRCVRF